MYPPNNESRPHIPRPRATTKRVRIIKKIRFTGGIWKFISLDRIGSRYVWDKQPGYYFVEWWEGKRRRRERAGDTPSQALEAQRRKRNELVGEMATGSRSVRTNEDGETGTAIATALKLRFDDLLRRMNFPE